MSYVSKYKSDTGGNRLWQLMASQGVTRHSWQSMKYHYKVLIAAKKKEKETAEKQNKVINLLVAVRYFVIHF